MEEKLRYTERLAGIGEMITGLAHESRNALQRAQACLELLQLKVDDQPDLLALTVDIEKAQDHLRYLFDEVRGPSEALGAVAAALHRGSGQRFNVGQKTLLVGGANRSWRIGGDQRQRKNCKDQRGLSPALAQIASLFGWGRGHKHAISPLKDRRVLHQSCQIISVPLVPGLSMFHRGLLGCTTLVA